MKSRKGSRRVTITGKSQRTYQYTVRKEIFYRTYSRRHAGTVTETRQIVVPAMLRNRVIGLALESIVSGHRGCKKTVDRITSFLGLELMVTSQDSADRVAYASERVQRGKSPDCLWVRCQLSTPHLSVLPWTW